MRFIPSNGVERLKAEETCYDTILQLYIITSLLYTCVIIELVSLSYAFNDQINHKDY